MKQHRLWLVILLASFSLLISLNTLTASAKTVWSYTTPKALRGTWYDGHYTIKGYKHSIGDLRYGDKSQTNYSSISNKIIVGHAHHHSIYGYRDRVYFRDIKPYAHQMGEIYTPIVFKYNHRHYKGLDVTGHAPDNIWTRTKLGKTISLSGWHSHKVALVHYGW
ncbi:hypothetical protein ACFP3T_09175 [Lactiplantibacillus dongliensis]|uniref:Extracellular protein n=1 Tax=Lactiplantibacillus dongliensis TaxID=2559919 RepID=A0ABW1R7L2_9LACO|nr:hypothetical protein [Lactiplantibacillus dongliensis]